MPLSYIRDARVALFGCFASHVQYKSADRWENFQLVTSNEQLGIAENNVSNTSMAGATFTCCLSARMAGKVM